MNEINIGEVYYIIARERAFNNADYLIEIILPSLPIEIISNSFVQIIDAAKLKAHYPLSFADCFAVGLVCNDHPSFSYAHFMGYYPGHYLVSVL